MQLSPSYQNKISQKEIRRIILANFKAGVSKKEFFKNRGLSPSTIYRYHSNLKLEKGTNIKKEVEKGSLWIGMCLMLSSNILRKMIP